MPEVLVAGCGFTGLSVARMLQAGGWCVTGLTRSEESAVALKDEPFRVRACDVSSAPALQKLADELGAKPDVVLHCASSGRGGADSYRSVYIGGAQNLTQAFPEARLVFTSSTSVYPQTDGEWVTEDSATSPETELSRLLLEAENVVLKRGGVVARIAGIYGAGRSVLLRKFFGGEAVIEDGGGRWINQAHRDDIATALALLIQAKAAGIYNIADDHPLQQHELYTRLAELFTHPLPPEGPRSAIRKRAWTSKRVSNAKLRSLGWAPKYPSFFDAIKDDLNLVKLAGGCD